MRRTAGQKAYEDHVSRMKELNNQSNNTQTIVFNPWGEMSDISKQAWEKTAKYAYEDDNPDIQPCPKCGDIIAHNEDTGIFQCNTSQDHFWYDDSRSPFTHVQLVIGINAFLKAIDNA